MRTVIRLLLLAAAVALGTQAVGWVAPAGVGLLWGVVGGDTRRPVLVGAAAAVAGWAGLLVSHAIWGDLGALLSRLGGVVGLPWPVLLGAPLLLGASSCGLAAWCGTEACRFLGPRRETVS